MVNLLGHVLKKDPAQSVILHVLLGSELYHDLNTCGGLLAIDVKISVHRGQPIDARIDTPEDLVREF
jgi:hypothetical protein